MLDSQPDVRREEIAIVGMAGRFPGGSNVDEFWENITKGVESVTAFSADELKASGIEAEMLQNPSFVNAGAVMPDADRFDAAFFGFTAIEAEATDPQHRVLLETAWEAIENAGYDPERFDGAIGVFAGVAQNTYLQENMRMQYDLNQKYGRIIALIGNDKDYAAMRVSFYLDLKGPSLSINTACSTSGVVTHLACQSLLTGECDMAIAGAARVGVPLSGGYLYMDGDIQSPNGQCRPFDSGAMGTVMGSGVGAIILKRLSDAIADNDTIHALIKGSAINNDGSAKVGFTAPNIQGQAAVIQDAIAMADIDPDTIGYIETHGTGTPLGDPIEIAGLTQAFRDKTIDTGFCAIGSVKANIGHLDAAAGMAGIIKTALSLKHKLLPPSINFNTPNPQIDFSNSPFYVNTKLRDWGTDGCPRRAGISSFGLGGTNAHIIMEEAPKDKPPSPSRPEKLLLLSAKTPTALDAATANLCTYLNRHRHLELADIAYTLQIGRKAFSHRRILVGSDIDDIIAAIEQKDPKRMLTASQKPMDRDIAFIFPGQGSQHVGMGLSLFKTEPIYQEAVNQCSEILKPHLSLDLRDVIYPKEEKSSDAANMLEQTYLAQPALFSIEYAVAKLWQSWGIHPNVLIGHSIGEYVAATLSGVFALEDALALVAARGRIMQECIGGSMLAVFLSEEEIEPLLDESLSLAAVNGPSICIVSGEEQSINQFEKKLSSKAINTRRLNSSHAFHSKMMDPILDTFANQVEQFSLLPPAIPFISNVTGKWITSEQATDSSYWVKHLRQTVRFSDGLSILLTAPDRIFLEVGPGNTFCNLAQRHPDCKEKQVILPSIYYSEGPTSDLACILTTLGQLWLNGTAINWAAFQANEIRRRLPLPTYPFERKKYWISQSPHEAEKPNDDIGSYMNNAVTPSALFGNNAHNEIAEETALVDIEHPTSESIKEPINRRDNLLHELKNLLQELSGLEEDEMDAEASFLEMGFDSLFLTQASIAFSNRFETKITLRLLLEELTSLDALASYLDEKLPADAFAIAKPTVQMPFSSHSNSHEMANMSILTQNVPTNNSLVERVIGQQMALMQQQLRLLQNEDGVKNAQPQACNISARLEAKNLQNKLSSDFNQQDKSALQLKPDRHSSEDVQEIKRHGPYQPYQPRAAAGLNENQQDALENLIKRYTHQTEKSKQLTQKHRQHFADPRAVAGFQPLWKEITYPIVTNRSQGSKVWDIDGNEYIDVTMGFGSILFGHSPDFIRKALEKQLKKGVEIGPQSPLAGEVASLICEFSGMDRATFCNTGSEAVLGALRSARTVSGRNKVVLFEGAYHGVSDEMLVRSSMIKGKRRSFPIAPGIPAEMVENVIVLEYGNFESLEVIEAHAAELACVLVEPVQSRKPELQPREFLLALQSLTKKAGIALIFDEIVTGFRIHPGGAQAWFSIEADIVTYGKVIGGGMPIGVIAGKAKYMDCFDGGMWEYGDDSFPEAGVTFFAGTFVRHPLAISAAHAVLNYLQKAGPELQESLNRKTSHLVEQINNYFEKFAVPIQMTHFGSNFHFSHSESLKLYSLFFHYLRLHGLHIWEGRPYFITTAHTDEDISRIIDIFKKSTDSMIASDFFPRHLSFPLTKQDVRSKTVTVVDSSDKVTLPLTEAQMEIWLATQLSSKASSSYNESCTLKLQGRVNIDALKQALQRAVERHESLRTTISETGEFQIIHPSQPIDIETMDLRSLSASEQEKKVSELTRIEGEKAFNLQDGPLLRTQYIQLDVYRHLLIITAHHIVCDGWSYDVMLRDLAMLYNEACGKQDGHAEKPMQMREYISWLDEEQSKPSYAKAEAYWLEQFTQLPPNLDLPTDLRRPPVRSLGGAREIREVGNALLQKVKDFGSRKSCTLFSVLLATYVLLLHRLSGQEDIAVGVPAASHSIIGGPNLIGHCTNLLPVRIAVNKSQTFSDLLLFVKSAILDAYESQIVTFGSIVKKLGINREPSRPPLLSCMFNIDPEITGLQFHGSSLEIQSNPRSGFQFDHSFNIVALEEGLIIECDYNSDLFLPGTMQRWIGHYIVLLEGIIQDADQLIGAIPLLSDKDKDRILIEWNDTKVSYDQKACIHEVIEKQAEKNPDKTAAIFRADQLTYHVLNAKASCLARYLRSIGAGPGTLVGIHVWPSLDMLVAVLGVLKAGSAYLPLDPSFPAERLSFMLEDSNVVLLLTHQQLAKREEFPTGQFQTICLDTDWDSIALHKGPDLESKATSSDLAYVIYTSGSTGKPKGVQICHRSVVNFLESMKHCPGIDADDVLLSVTTLSFDISVLELLLPLVAGATVALVSREETYDGLMLPMRIAEAGATIMQATPTTWRILLEAGWEGNPRLKILCGGEAFPPDLANQLLGKCRSLWNMYGPTETTIWSSVYQVTDEQKNAVPIGRPIANTQMYILDGEMKPAPVGISGRLYIGGDGLAKGYLNRPEINSSKFVSNPFSIENERLYDTGDLARYLPDGNIVYLNRIDSQVKIRGFRIELGDIESALGKHDLVRQNAVAVREVVPGDKQLVAYIVPETNAKVLAHDQKQNEKDNRDVIAALRDHLQNKLPQYMLPGSYVLLESLPLTPNGKIDRKSLPLVRSELFASRTKSRLPETEIEKMLAGIWKRVLNKKDIRAQDNFFDIGGHSLLAVRVFAEIEKAFGKRLPLATILQKPTIEELAAVIGKETYKPSWSSLVPIQTKGSKNPFYCIHGAGGNVLLYRDLAKHLGTDQPLFGLQAKGLDGNSAHLSSVEEMAAAYIEEILMHQPDGPYHIGGYCLGGSIAFEMARQLDDMGKEVGIVALLDTQRNWIVENPMIRLYQSIQNVGFHLGNLINAGIGGIRPFLSEKTREAWRRTKRRSTAFLSRIAYGCGFRKTEPLLAMEKINDRAADKYIPSPYSGRITIFKAKRAYAGYGDKQLGWGNGLAAGVDVEQLSVYPAGMLIEPFVAELAHRLRIKLDSVENRNPLARKMRALND